ncbi:unnamed protein product, partial [Amoebophrya sp. A25]
DRRAEGDFLSWRHVVQKTSENLDISSLLFAIPEPDQEQRSESEEKDRKGLTRADVAMDAIRQHAKSVASGLAKESANDNMKAN